MMKKYLWLLTMMLMLVTVLPPAAASRGSQEITYPAYIALEPVTVNLNTPRRTRFLRVDIELLVQDKVNHQLIDFNMPLIRDQIVTMLGGRNPEDLQTHEARETLRQQVREAVRDTLINATGYEAINDLFFSGFIVQ